MSAKNDVTKLPQWAQDRIRQLEGSVAHYKQKAYQVEEGETNVWVDWLMETYYLPEDSMVVFKQIDGRLIEICHSDRGGLEVRCPQGGISLRPIAGNIMLLRGEGL